MPSLSTGQRRALRRLASSAEAAPYLARRASRALAAADGDTDRAAAMWLRRYLREGVSGLEDARRSGRPSQLSDLTVRTVLMEPLFVASAKWTSRTLADAVGISQASVVRLWARTFATDTLAETGPWHALDRNCRPTGLLLGTGGAVMVLELITTGRPSARAGHRPRATHGTMRSPLRPLIQTILAGELVEAGPTMSSTAEFLAAAMPNPAATYVVVCGADTAPDPGEVPPSAVVELVRVPTGQWQALLPHLTVAVTPASRSILEILAHRVREWAAKPDAGFCWTAAAPSAPEATPEPAQPPTRSLLLSPNQRLAEYVARAILDGILSGRLRAGDRLTESYLMRTAHASRGQVREALHTLAMDGLIELRRGRGAIVPMPTGDDVLETYALRRAVGGLAMAGAATNWRPGQLGAILQAMTSLQQIAATGDVRATDDADLDFQDVLAAAANLRRVLMTFRRLTIQLRMFTTVMGLKYAYSIEDIIVDDTAILDAVRRRDAVEARQLWDQKMEAAVRYMVRQLERAD